MISSHLISPSPFGVYPSVCVCVHRYVITNGFSSVFCACTILKSRGQRYPCHFLCQRSWVTCGKDIGQGRLIYVPAIVSTVDFLFLFMSCALFLRSRIRVRWNSTARQLRKSGEDYDIIHTFYLPLPHSVCLCLCLCARLFKWLKWVNMANIDQYMYMPTWPYVLTEILHSFRWL